MKRIMTRTSDRMTRWAWWCLPLLITCHLSFVTLLHGQQPQTTNNVTAGDNAQYLQGVGTGYRPTAGTGLALNIAAGTAYCGSPQLVVSYAGGVLNLPPSQTNYVYFDPAPLASPTAPSSLTALIDSFCSPTLRVPSCG